MTHSTTVSELLPCPFCGVSPFADVQNGACGPTGQAQFVWCEKCDGCGPERYNEADAITAWNTRAQAQGSEAVAWQYSWRNKDSSDQTWKHVVRIGSAMPVLRAETEVQDARRLYTSPPVQAQPQGVVVKALDWEEVIPGRLVADIYMVERVHLDEWCWKIRAVKAEDWPRTVAGHLTLDAAKAAAQADYERRILSALATPPAPVDGGVTDAMIDAGLFEYSEGGCSGLDQRERREVVTSILNAALTASRAAVAQDGK